MGASVVLLDAQMREPARKNVFMSPHKTITINGRLYDAVTGMPVNGTPENKSTAKPAPKPAASSTPRPKTSSESEHGSVQRSKTLARRTAKKPAAPHKVVARTQAGRHMDIAVSPKSTQVAKFAPHPVTKPAPAKKASPKSAQADSAPRPHPVAEKALQRTASRKVVHQKSSTKTAAAKQPTSKEVKDAEIAKALATPKQKTAKKHHKKHSPWRRRLLIIGICAVAIAAVLYGIYQFIPSVSVGIAASQAGINASYPEYVPDGYRLNQPVTYSDGEVDLTFKSTSNDTMYTIIQTRSSWDSTAVLDNIVKPATGDNYTTTKERGLTIYTYGQNAAWVNGGILYTINGDAPLSNDQIRRIATSL